MGLPLHTLNLVLYHMRSTPGCHTWVVEVGGEDTVGHGVGLSDDGM